MRIPLALKLILLNIPALIVTIGGIFLAIEYQAGVYFEQLMHDYHISPEGPHHDFVERLRGSLILLFIAALVLTSLSAALITWRLTRPINALNAATKRLAQGDFSKPVAIRTGDEIEELGINFDAMTKKLDDLESLRRRMITDVAHELRTPLTNLRGYIEAARDKVLPIDDKTLGILEDETQRLRSVVERLMQLAKADAAPISIRARPVEAKALLERALVLVKPGFERRGFRLDVAWPEDGLTVLADEDMILQVLSNLLGNVVAHAPDGAQVRLWTDRAEDRLAFCIENSGAALPEAQLSLLFERFYRADESRARSFAADGGLGLGLSISKAILDAHQGGFGARNGEIGPLFWFDLSITSA